MRCYVRSAVLVTAATLVLGSAAPNELAADDVVTPSRISFNRDVRPILADKCFACHGPDSHKREAELRLDVREDAVIDRGGYGVIVAGQADESELIRRLVSEEEFERMPPDTAGKSLSPRDIEILRRWITEGAEYEDHWSFVPPRVPPVPEAPDPEWPRNEIDRFVASKHAELGVSPNPDADPRTLLRRLSFDLLGLPPDPEFVRAFANDASPASYEAAVDRLLASKHFGERMAVFWLDVVRYADTGGYHSDNHREIALYRDYVINAFNDNLPFDQFTLEQLAGDLLPDATISQKIASGYNRLLQTTEEGGAQPKEYTAKYQADRVRNTATAWLGITMGCCECHNHKFDPFSMEDFYSFAGFFADIQERAVGRQEQFLVPNAEERQRLDELEAAVGSERKELERTSPERDAAFDEWATKATAKLNAPAEEDSPPLEGDEKTEEAPKEEKKEQKLPPAVTKVLTQQPEDRTEKDLQLIRKHYRDTAPEFAPLRESIAKLEKQLRDFRATVPKTLISATGPPRTVRVLARGNWQDDSGKVVEPATPQVFPAGPIEDRALARLDLAHWMIRRENPLVARVFVNRAWKLFFGQGIVGSLDDFGTQGQWPSHPQLLDWLAIQFQESGWDVKHLVKLMVLSRTYQQSSVASDDLLERDPGNAWLARQSRFRLDAEIIRDNALAVSGLLATTIGGPSVKPYQPAGYWQHLNFPKRTWQNDHGANLYRRGLYTYWQRTFLHPSLAAFDAPSREECTVDRPRSNTPLQALVLLNDPTYVEAARALATRIMEGDADTDAGRLDFAFQEVLSRPPKPRESDILTKLLNQHRQEYQDSLDDAKKLVEYGESKLPETASAQELAAWTTVARVILNLHETITRY